MGEGILILFCLLKGLLTITIPFIFDIYGVPFLLAGLIWYGIDYNQLVLFGKAAYVMCAIGTAFCVWMFLAMEFPKIKGIDGIGEALAKAFVYRIARAVSLVSAAFLFVIGTKALPHRLFIILGFLVLSIVICVALIDPRPGRHLSGKVLSPQDGVLHSVKELKEELRSRDFLSEDGILFGIDGKCKEKESLYALSFPSDARRKFPAYMYLTRVANYLGKEESQYFYVFYINGQIMVLPAYPTLTGHDFEIRPEGMIFAENERISVYDFTQNRYIALSEKDGVGCNQIRFKEELDGFYYNFYYLNETDHDNEETGAVIHVLERVDREHVIKDIQERTGNNKS